MTKDEAALFVSRIMILWPNYRPAGDADLIAETWGTVLSDVPMSAAIQALAAIARRHREFAPTPGLILDTVRELTGQRYPTPDEALAEIDRVGRQIGYSAGRPPQFHNGQFRAPAKPEFSCEPIRRAVESVGWRDLCLATDESRSVIRSNFLKIYREVRDRAELHAASTPLAGPEWRITDQVPRAQVPSEVG